MNDTIKKQNIVFILACVLSFMMGCYFFNIIQQKTTQLGDKVRTVQTGVISPFLTGTEASGAIKLNTTTKTTKDTTTTGNKVVYQKPVKPILIGGVSAGYDGDSEYERTRNQLIKLGLTYEQAESIVREGYANTSGGKQFVKSIIGVSNAEGGIFKHGLYNNYLGVMYNGSLRHYDTFALGIEHWRQLYNKNKWYLNTEPQDWLDRHYCVGGCNSRVKNYNAGVLLLNI